MKYNPPFTNSFHFSFVLKKAVSKSSFFNCISYKNYILFAFIFFQLWLIRKMHERILNTFKKIEKEASAQKVFQPDFWLFSEFFKCFTTKDFPVCLIKVATKFEIKHSIWKKSFVLHLSNLFSAVFIKL